ncbi:unnamed protein product [Cylicocyclus nassatus]|uniref:Uncharacterized protein n=1 Tax=Cylicocyclus nassatus TaxID=53992 RepID=A0AA36MD38_CYLNA|nr:unnamed protein product [Cylicocyclus nassatus]
MAEYENLGPGASMITAPEPGASMFKEPPPPPDLPEMPPPPPEGSIKTSTGATEPDTLKETKPPRGKKPTKNVPCRYLFLVCVTLYFLVFIWTFILYLHAVEIANLVPIFDFLAPADLDSLRSDE